MKLGTTLLMAFIFASSLGSLDGCKTAEQKKQEADREQAIRYKVAIEKALREDELTGHEPTEDHTKAMRKVDITDCPPEFREAYMKHIHAWEEAVVVREAKIKLDNQAGEDLVSGLLCQAFNADCNPVSDHLDLEQRLRDYASAASADIQSSFEEVENIASRYGAVAPKVQQ